jgi:uncharacterized membrane protein
MSTSEINEPDSLVTKSKLRSSSPDRKWQIKLLPLMKTTIVGLIVFFFAASFFQLLYLQSKIENSPPVNTDAIFSNLQNTDSAKFREKLEATSLKAKVYLEENIISRRYRQAGSLLMSGVWVRYMGFITGMILAMVGAVFILGKLQETASDVGIKIQGNEANIKSTSPGLILCFLGAILMALTVIMQQKHNVIDSALYFESSPYQKTGLDTTEKPAFNIQDSSNTDIKNIQPAKPQF